MSSWLTRVCFASGRVNGRRCLPLRCRFPASAGHHELRLLSPSPEAPRDLSVVAGSGLTAPYVDGLRGSLAAVEHPSYVTVLANNDTVFSDAAYSVVRSVSYGTGILGRVAGVPGVSGFQGGPALAALMRSPAGLCSMSTTTAPLGALYIAGAVPGRQW